MKYVIFESGFDYCKAMCGDIRNREDVLILKPMNFFCNSIFEIHQNIQKRINKDFDYKFWLNFFTGFEKIDESEEIVFCFFDSSKIGRNIKFIKWLKNKFKKSIIVSIILNKLENRTDKIDLFNKYYDLNYTFDPYEAKMYEFKYFYTILSKIDLPSIKVNKDISFVGADKGRLDNLRKIYNSIKNNNISADFKVVSKVSEGKEYEEIISEKFFSYREALEIELSANCILDYSYVRDGEQGLSLRIAEAVLYDKKILTNNKYIKETPFYDENFVQIFTDEKDIDYLFIKEKNNVKFKNKDLINPNRLLDMIKIDYYKMLK